MSTKTLRKRIALVAVTTLGAGLLSVVAVPSANAAVDLTVAANGLSTSSTQGLLTGGGTSAITVTTTTATATMLSGGRLSIGSAAGATTSAVVVSGGTISSCAETGGTATLSADRTTCSSSVVNGVLTVLAAPTTVQEEAVTPAAPVVIEQPKKISKKSSGITVEEFNDQMDISVAQLESVAVMAETLAMIQVAEEGTN